MMMYWGSGSYLTHKLACRAICNNVRRIGTACAASDCEGSARGGRAGLVELSANVRFNVGCQVLCRVSRRWSLAFACLRVWSGCRILVDEQPPSTCEK